ncbi:unnamed protein product, partial [Mesorhabditis belari]|uniref:Protein zer-1 homolog-like C-terminal domain-containing protein n=1 Tax=Mesorhabditis belari TaxID=2138241 RepID=A0AAF3FJV6_9BILA
MDDDIISYARKPTKFGRFKLSVKIVCRRIYKQLRKLVFSIVRRLGFRVEVEELYRSEDQYDRIRQKIELFSHLNRQGYDCCADVLVGMETERGIMLKQEEHLESLRLVVAMMKKHIHDKVLQGAALNTLCHILQRIATCKEMRNEILSVLLKGMEIHLDDRELTKLYCDSLAYFDIPQDVDDYNRLAFLFTSILQKHLPDKTIQKTMVFRLNTMASHSNENQKVLIGSLGVIELVLLLIGGKIETGDGDYLMETAWSFLWTITDNTPMNCEKFLRESGLSLFEDCYQKFYEKQEIVYNMMGVIGNLAEVEMLRCQLMKDELLTIFCELLSVGDLSMEISYNSAGVLAHLAADKALPWNQVLICRQRVMENIVKATWAWKLEARRFINYDTFQPLLKLLSETNAFGSRHWAVWGIAHLTTTYPKKYCQLLECEGGVQILEDLSDDENATGEIQELASIALNNIKTWVGKEN